MIDQTPPSSAGDGLALDLITDRAAIAALGAEWEALRRRQSWSHPMLAFEYWWLWVEHLSPEAEVIVARGRLGAESVILAPFQRTSIRPFGVALTTLTLAGADWDYGPLLIDDGAVAQLPTFLRQLLDHTPADVIELPHLRRCPPEVASAIEAAAAVLGRHLDVTTESELTLELTSTWDEYLSRRSKNFRKSQRRTARAMAEADAVEIVPIRGGQGYQQTVDEVISAVMSVSADSWKAEAGSAICSTPATAAYYADLIRALYAGGALQGLIVTVEGVPSAYLLDARDGETVVGLDGAYSQALATYSSGNVMQYRILEQLFADPTARHYDFMGMNPYMRSYTSEVLEVPTYSLVDTSRSTTVARRAERLKREARPLARRYGARIRRRVSRIAGTSVRQARPRRAV